MRWEVPIPDWRPHALNELLKVHWRTAARRKALDRQYVVLYARLAGVPRAAGKRRVSLLMTIPKGQRRWDVDAMQKSTLDAAKHAGLIRDDCEKWAAWGGVDYRRGGGFHTTIIVEDIT